MRICIATHKVLRGDGQGRVNYEIASHAVSEGHEVILVASEVDATLLTHPRVRWIRMEVSRYPTELLRNQVFAFRSYAWIRRHRSELDVLHVNGFLTWSPADVNLVHFVHSSWIQSPFHTSKVRKGVTGWYQWLYTALNARLQKRTFQGKAKVIVAVSQLVKEQLVETGIAPGRIRLITNGVDIAEFHPGESERAFFALPEVVPLALFAGDLRTPRKNLDTVLAALVRVGELHLTVLGDLTGSVYPELCKRLGISNRVHFLGYRRDISRVMRSVDMFIFPSRYEACSLVILEALASGLPVVTARTAGGAELVTRGSGFVLDDPNDVAGLVESMRQLVRDPTTRQVVGREARSVAEKNRWDAMAADYLRLYHSVTQKRSESKGTKGDEG